jgi:hypothetical protein
MKNLFQSSAGLSVPLLSARQKKSYTTNFCTVERPKYSTFGLPSGEVALPVCFRGFYYIQ